MTMSALSESSTLSDRLKCDDVNGTARQGALAAVLPQIKSPASLVGYQSQGRLLIVGPGTTVRLAAESVSTGLTVTLLITDAENSSTSVTSSTSGNAVKARSIQAEVAEIRGYLGNFQIDIHSEGDVRPLAPSVLTANQPYDLVLDLSKEAYIRTEVPPTGYFAPGRDGERIQQALDNLAALVGDFEKPNYLNYNTDICAHGASGLSGCRRCLDTCPTDAVKSIGERIEVDPYLCQGGGACASSCPSGALRYAYPALPDLLSRIRTRVDVYLDAGGVAPSVLLYAGDAGSDWLLEHAPELPENCLPFALEEVASVGLESWLSLLAFGVCGIGVLCPEQTPPALKAVVHEQMGIAQAMLDGMGFCEKRFVVLDGGTSSIALLGAFSTAMIAERARYQIVDEKRTTIRQALDHLYAQAPAPAVVWDLPAGAPFGEIQIDKDKCTLCTACVTVCPAGAVLAGDSLPQLNFIEQNCLQCGVCATGCPEDAIKLHPRILYPFQERTQRRVINEDAPFLCVRCNKPFSSTRSIEIIIKKLAAHWMYADNPAQVQRLKMCDDCKVRDMFEQDTQLLDVHKD